MKAARELLDDLATAGVSVWVEDGRLKYKAEAGALTADIKARVQALRADVVAILSGKAPQAARVKKSQAAGPERHPSEQRVDRDLLEDVKAWSGGTSCRRSAPSSRRSPWRGPARRPPASRLSTSGLRAGRTTSRRS